MVNLMLGDCLERMKEIPDGSVDMILADPPYGTTACKWDVVIPFEPMWAELKRIIKSNGAIVLFGGEPFSSFLRLSNIKSLKHEWYWDKQTSGNFIQAKNTPLNVVENIIVFCIAKLNYMPILQQADDRKKRPLRTTQQNKIGIYSKISKGEFKTREGYDNNFRYPKNIISINKGSKECNSAHRLHPTQKPVELMEYLIKTYTQEGETVLDFVMGSGTTGVACKNLGRNFIGIEKDETYFKIAQDRINAI